MTRHERALIYEDTKHMFRKQHWELCEATSFRYEIGGCGFATFISVICPICGATEDITDIDSW